MQIFWKKDRINLFISKKNCIFATIFVCAHAQAPYMCAIYLGINNTTIQWQK